MITICVGTLNKTPELLNYLIASMNGCRDKGQLALSVFDFNSTDVENLESEIRGCWKGDLIFRSEERKFTRAYAINQAVSQANGDKVFVCDADMTLPADFVEQYLKSVGEESVWFPICYSLFKGKKREIAGENGWWRGTGHGMVGLLKESFESLGGYNPNFIEWGGEDDDLFIRAHLKYEVNRDKCIGLFHNWHPLNWLPPGGDKDEISAILSLKHTKDLTLRSRELLLFYAKDLITSSRGREARKFLLKNYPYKREMIWWKMWLGSWMTKLLSHPSPKPLDEQ